MDKALGRIPYLDNAKLWMMFLVVYGHLLEPMLSAQPSSLVRTLYLLIYLFHVSVFVFLAGLTSKVNTSISRLLKIFSVFAVFQAVYVVSIHNLRHDYLAWLFRPWWILWFLLSLVCWKLLLPIALKFPWPIALSIMIALGAGLSNHIGGFLGLSRTLVWFPLFLAGHLYGRAILIRTSHVTWITRIAAAASFILAGCALWKWPFVYLVLYESESYSAMGIHTAAAGLAFRTAHLLAACILGYAALCLIPARQTLVTKFGTRTLAMLVVQPLLITLLWHSVLLSNRFDSVFALAVFAVVVTLMSGVKPAYRLVAAISAFPEKLTRLATA
jgi:fucose 4-O-acetylase-like acetyltransferase